jgi:adenine-specific DNA-methyltransferase
VATGTPKRKAKEVWVSDSNSFQADGSIHLSYPGKQPTATILSRSAELPVCRWRGGKSPANRLYFGENADVLASLANDPAVCGKVKLVYIDPPFATQTAFHSRKQEAAYEDLLIGTEYIEFLRQRLVLIHRLLADDGSLYLHLDGKMVFHIKVILDEIFGPEGFRTCITRKKCNPKNYTRKQYGNVSDYILFYSKTSTWIWNRPVEAWTDERAKEYQYVDAKTGRSFMKVPVHAPGIRKGETGGLWRGKLPPPGKHWQYLPSTLDEMDARGEIYWSANGNPRRKVYLDESPGVGVQDIWLEFRDAHNQNICITGYPTEKNPSLLKRIIEASSNPGDLVLDCFAGSGTTLAVADQLNRSWIGVDNSTEALRTILKRFAEGTEPMGDFVGVRGSQQKTVDLLSSLTQGEEGSLTLQKHQRIKDFSIWTSTQAVEEVDQILAEWEAQAVLKHAA